MNDLIPKDKEEIIQQEASSLKDTFSSMVINNDEDLKAMSAFLASVKKRINRIKEIKDNLVKPLKESVRTVDNWFKEQSAPFLDMEVKAKSMIGEYMIEQERLAREAAAIAQAEQRAPIEKPSTKINTDAGRVNMAKVWTYEIEDISKVPRELMTLDSYAVRQKINAGERTIPGLKIYQKSQIKVSV